MNNNVRGIRSTSDKQSYKNSGIGTRHSSISTPNNNIHININLNVKKKSQCIIHGENPTGKKINNFVQVNDPKNQHEGSGLNDDHEKHSQQLMKSTAIGKAKFLTTNKKSQADKKMQKTKKKKIKQKQKTASKPYTPQKQQKGQSEEKSFQRSKTGKKLAKKKQSKSMQNLKVFKEKHTQENKKVFDLMNYHQRDNKLKSKQNSSSKQRSRQKSATKLKKNRSSSKNIVAPFQNSGIKKVLATQRETINKSEGLQHLRKSKKSLKSNKHAEKDLIKIHEFMQEKNKNDNKKKKQAQYSTKGIRIKDELLKASKQRKQFFSKPQKKQTSHGLQSRKNSKFPIYFGDEDENNQAEDSSVFRIERNTNFSNHRTPQKSRVQSLRISPQGHKKSGTKKRAKQSLLEKYKNGRLTSAQYEKLITKIIMIQANWRGYNTRKKLLQQISKMNRLTSEKKRLINEKKSEFWDDDENNSITNLQYEAKNQTLKQKHSQQNQYFNGSGFSFRTPQGSNYNSSSTPTDEIHTNNKKYESESGNEIEYNQYEHQHRIKIDDFKKNIIALQKQKQAQKIKRSTQQKQKRQSIDEQSSVNNNFLVNQIQLLKKQLQQQNKKFSQLQKENTQLKENLMSVIVEKKQKGKQQKINYVEGKQKWQNGLQSEKSNIQDESVEIYDIKMVAVKNNTNTQTQNNKIEQKKVTKQNKFKNLKIQTDEQIQKPIIKQQFIDNINTNNKSIKSPSSSSMYVQSLKRELSSFQSPSNRQLKSAQLSGLKNLQRAFKKKQLSIQLTYEKNSTMYQQMLQNNIVSPRTYNFKKIELDEKYKRQKQEISSKFKQAQKVIKYISEEIVQEEKAGEDESPRKDSGVEVDVIDEIKKVNKVKETKNEINKNTIGITKIIQAVSVNVSQQQSHQSHSSSQYQSHVIKQISINNTNNIPTQNKQQINAYISPQIQVFNENSSTHSNFRKYWTDDLDEVHKKVLEISNKIDQALLQGQTERQQLHKGLHSSQLKSQQLKQYSSQNSNFYSLNKQSNGDQNNIGLEKNVQKQFTNDEKQSIYEQNQYSVNQQKKQGKQLFELNKEQRQISIDDESLQQQQQQVMPNISSHSHQSDKSGRSLQSYNIHYPSSPSNSEKEHQSNQHNTTNKYHFEVKNQVYNDDNSQPQQLSLQANNSQLSQNRSSISQSNNSIISSSTTRQKQPKGFDTRLTFIKQYCIALCEFIRSQDDLKQKFIENISTPLRYDYFEYLKSYRLTINMQHDTKYNSTTEQYFYPYFKLVKGTIIPKGLNDENTSRFDQLYNQSYGINKQLTQQMLQIRKFFIHAIIDVFNESLDFERPGSIYGQPLPWLVQSRNLKNNHVKFLKQSQINQKNNLLKLKNNRRANDESQNQDDNEQDQRLDKIFGIAIAKIIQWGSCLCGFIPQPVSFDGEQTQAVNIDEQQTNLVRQTRLAYMLQKSLAQDEQKMVDHTMQQLQVQLQLQQIIFQQLISQCVNEINTIGKGSKN